jgi:hypothetical protein
VTTRRMSALKAMISFSRRSAKGKAINLSPPGLAVQAGASGAHRLCRRCYRLPTRRGQFNR